MTLPPEELARLREAASSAADAGCELFAAEPSAVIALLDELERLRAENAKLRAKCEERKAVLKKYQWCDTEGGVWDPCEFALCPACGNRVSRRHKPDCEWQRAMEDV